MKLLCAASGDLRNLVRTINSIPRDYSGTITVVLNDRDPFVTLRNILIMRILGTVTDKSRAVDMALHLWYSAFLPNSYYAEILGVATSVMLGSRQCDVQLSANSSLSADIDASLQYLCARLCSSSENYGAADTANNYYQMRFVK